MKSWFNLKQTVEKIMLAVIRFLIAFGSSERHFVLVSQQSGKIEPAEESCDYSYAFC